MFGFIRTILFSALACLAAGIAVAKPLSLGIMGGPGGSPFRDVCPEGSYLVGVTAHVGDWVDSVEAQCNPFVPGQGKSFGEDVEVLRHHGGNGGVLSYAICGAQDLYIISMRVGTTSDAFVDFIEFACSGAGGPAGGGYDIACLSSGGSCLPAEGQPYLAQSCPDGMVAVGLRGASGDFVDSVALICDVIPPFPSDVDIVVKPPDSDILTKPDDNADIMVKPPRSDILTKPNDDIMVKPPHSDILTEPDAGAQTPDAEPAGYVINCRGGGRMTAKKSKDGFVRITFDFAAEGSAAAAPGPGQCAWVDRGFRSGEPEMLAYPAKAKGANSLLQAAAGGTFQVHAYNNNDGVMVVTRVDKVVLKQPPNSSTSNPAQVSFTGRWNSQTGSGGVYTITLRQRGNTVRGIYIGQDGSRGTIIGRLRGTVLSFNWTQEGGYAGSGHFDLAGDTFEGDYSTSVYPDPTMDPDLLTGTWQGERQ